MIEVAALLLCKLGGMSGSADEISAVISAGGGKPDEARIATLAGDVEGKDVSELLGIGMGKLRDVPMGGGGGEEGRSASITTRAIIDILSRVLYYWKRWRSRQVVL